MISKLLSFIRVERNDAKINDVKIDLGGGDNVTAEDFTTAGDDTFPLKTDYVFASATGRSGGKAVVGYLDPINTPKATEGDKRIYARDPSDGTVVAEVWLKSDKSIIVSNDNGALELKANGDINLNGVIIKANGDMVVPSSLVLNGKELDAHNHPIAWTDPAGSGTSGPNN